jgi:hypothetical protein
MTRLSAGAIIASLLLPATLRAQDGLIIYRLGNDTVAVERFSRSANRFAGEMVSRSGAVVIRTAYELALAAGRVTTATVRRMQADGTPLPNAPIEYRFRFGRDSASRTLVWADSTSARAFAAANALPALPVFVYAPFMLLNEAGPGSARDSVPTIGLGGNATGFVGLERLGGDTVRLRGAPYPMRLRFGADGRLLVVDGTMTTNKAVGTLSEGPADLAAIARAMKPTGVLSPRVTEAVSIGQGPILINYGSPAVRGRSVWGGTLVPYDSVWRTGANEATHLATSKTLQLGDLTLAPGVYTLWIQHRRSGTDLIVSRKVGMWGTLYDPAADVGRVPMTLANAPEFAEDFRITIRSLGQGRGAFDFAWGDRVATASFSVRP